MELTIVIPVYNRESIVGRTLDSIASQTLRPLSVVLVDNGSTDATLDLLRRWQRDNNSEDFNIRVIEETRKGAAAAREAGLKLVETPLTMFFDSDDLMSPDHCERVVEGFRQMPEADIIGWDCRGVMLDGSERRLEFSARDCVWGSLMYGVMSTQRYAARTELFRKAGGWNPLCLGWDDIELGLRMLSLSPMVRKLDGESRVVVCATEDSITGRSFTAKSALWENALVLMEHDRSRRIRRYVNLRRAILAGDYRHEGNPQEGERLMKIVAGKERCPFYRGLNRLAYLYRGKGGRGIARLMRPLF